MAPNSNCINKLLLYHETQQMKEKTPNSLLNLLKTISLLVINTQPDR